MTRDLTAIPPSEPGKINVVASITGGAGLGETTTINEGTTLGEYINLLTGNGYPQLADLSRFQVMVRRGSACLGGKDNPLAKEDVLEDGDKVIFTPNKNAGNC